MDAPRPRRPLSRRIMVVLFVLVLVPIVGWSQLVRVLQVPELLARAGIDHGELLELLATRFVPGGGAVTLDSPGGGCDLSQMTLQGADAGTFDRLHRFVRLRRACGWTTAELDVALHSLGAAELSGPVLDDLAVIEGLRRRLGAPVARLCAMWAPIDTWGERSPYAALLMDPAVLPAAAGVFTLDAAGGELLDTSQPLDDHASAVASAIGASMAELEALRAAQGYAGPVTMTLAMLSDLYRHVTLARLLQVEVVELLALRTMVGAAAAPFVAGAPAATHGFVERALELARSPLSLAELRYLVLHEASAGRDPAPTDAEVDAALQGVLDDLAEASALYGTPAEMSEAELARRLAVFIDDDALVRELVAALDLRVSTDPLDPLGGLPIDTRKDLYDDYVEAVDAADYAALFDDAPTDEEGLAARHLANLTLVIEALGPWLKARLAPATVASALATATGLDVERTAALLEQHLGSIADASAPLMGDFVEMTDPAATRDAYLRLDKAVRVVKALSIRGSELGQLPAALGDPAPTQPADLRAWPTQAPAAPEALLEQWRQLSALASLAPS
ncbi:MAG: hypothetical protein KDK70_26955, partial [Myxococcales bacterium]|nr:hypothetical protein [Myxococcales bacterium]